MNKNSQGDLVRAIYSKDLGTLVHLLAKGADVNEVDPHGRPAIMHAILAEKPDLAAIELLVQAGANIKLADKEQKWTSLHFAARDGNAPIVQKLLEAGAEVNAQDVYGNTPLWRAVMGARTDTSAIELLIRSGADPNLKNKSGVSPSDLAERLGRYDVLAIFARR